MSHLMDQVEGATNKVSNDAWLELQAFKTRQLNRKEKLNRHKRPFNEDTTVTDLHTTTPSTTTNSNTNQLKHRLYALRSSLQNLDSKLTSINQHPATENNDCISPVTDDTPSPNEKHSKNKNNNHVSYKDEPIFDVESVECLLLLKLCDVALKLPIDSTSLLRTLSKIKGLENLSQYVVEDLLQKFSHQELITIEEPSIHHSLNNPNEDETCIYVTSADHTKLVEFDKSLGSLDNLRAVLAEANQTKNELCIDESDISIHRSVPIQSVRQTQDSQKIEQSSNYQLKNLLQQDSDETPSSLYYKTCPNNQGESQQIEAKDDVECLLNLHSTKEKESKKIGQELLELLSKPTAKEKNLLERFKSADGYRVQEFCPKGTKDECRRCNRKAEACNRLHFKKIIAKHTEESLGDCSFLNTCFHMDSCKYVHYEVDYDDKNQSPNHQSTKSLISQTDSIEGVSSLSQKEPNTSITTLLSGKMLAVSTNLKGSSSDCLSKYNINKKRFKTITCPPQWIQCDLRFFDMSMLGKFSVVMADPPWDIHMELPYGTMSDDEMRKLNIPALQDDGVIFLWVTGRAMELGRECLSLWGYDRVDEIIWVKTNQLQRIIRTGRTGHWLNHGKEHCLVGIKGNPKDINRGLDCDVIVAEVRATSHKPDEIYGIIERLSPGTRKIELFARQHNIQPNWISLGNQLAGYHLVDPELLSLFKKSNFFSPQIAAAKATTLAATSSTAISSSTIQSSLNGVNSYHAPPPPPTSL